MTQPKIMRYGIFLGNFLFSLSSAITIYTNSSFIEKNLGVDYTAIIYSISSILSIFILFTVNKSLRKFGNRTFFLFYGALYSLSLGILSLPFLITAKIIALIIYLLATNIIIFSFNLFFAHLSGKKERGNLRGFFLLFGNLGVIAGPIISTHLINFAGFSGMYMAGLIVFAILSVTIEYTFQKYSDPKYLTQKAYFAVKNVLIKKTLRNVVMANFILQFFYSWMIIYIPIYLIKILGFSWNSVGIIFALMLVPFVLLDYPLGKFADWLKSEKELCAIGFLIMIICLFSIATIKNPSVFTMGLILFFSRIGAATVEAMTEIHFFKIAQDSDPFLISLFSDLRPLGYVIAPILGALSVSFFEFRQTFFVLGIILFIGLFVSFFMEKNQDWWIAEHKN